MKRIFATLFLTSALVAPLAAQEQQLSGTVAEVFGTQAIVNTPSGRVLVTLPPGTPSPVPGAQISLTGTNGTFAATTPAPGVTTAATPGVTATAGGATSPAEARLPPALRGLGLTEIRSRPDDKGEVHIYARNGAGWLRAEMEGDRLQEVKTDGAGLPASLLDKMLPGPARTEPRLVEITRLSEIDLDGDRKISVEGYGSDGMRIKIDFTRDGVLRGFKRERDDRRSMSEPAARERLTALRYTDIGFVHRTGKHVTAAATNPYGDAVEVRLDELGRVERERLWQN